MVQNIREAFIENLETVDWMDSQTKQAAKEKVRGLRNPRKIAYECSLIELKDWKISRSSTMIYRKRYSHWKKLGQSNSVTENTGPCWKHSIFIFPKIAEDFRTLLRTIQRCFDQRATYLIVEVSNITSNVIDIIRGKNYRNFTREKLWLLSGLEIIRSSYVEKRLDDFENELWKHELLTL